MKTIFISVLTILLFAFPVFSQETNETTEISEIEETGDYQKALSNAKKMLEKDSLNENLWVETGKLYRLNQQYKQAIGAYEKALKINPSNKKHLLSLAKTYRLAGSKDASIKLYREFLQYEPNNIMALIDLGQIYSSSNLTDSAAVTYKKLYLLDTLNVEYLQKWASNQWFSGNYKEGFINYKKAYWLDSTYLPVVFDLARIYINNKFQDSAIAILEMNIKVAPQESRLYADLGNAIFSKAEYLLAIPNYEKAIELGFRGNDAYKRLGICYYSTKEFEKSQKIFEYMILKDSTDYRIFMYLGNIYNNLDEAAKAIVSFNKAISLLTPDPMVVSAIYSGLIESYRVNGNFSEQISTILKRSESLPIQYRSPQYLFEIAQIYELDLKDKKKAVKYYQDYYAAIKEISTYSKENKEAILSKINRLKQD